jgi:precorrin-2 methylase
MNKKCVLSFPIVVLVILAGALVLLMYGKYNYRCNLLHFVSDGYPKRITVQKGKLYIVGVGPSGPSTATLEALEVINQADVIFCAEHIKSAFQKYLKGKDVRLQYKSVYVVDGKQYPELDGRDLVEMGRRLLVESKELNQTIREELGKGKIVAVLENGDPCIFGTFKRYVRGLKDEEYEIIPGMSSFNAANALLKRDLVPRADKNKTVILTTGFGPQAEGQSLEELASHKATMVFLCH